jgi:anti-sigma factor RsiW
MAERCPWSERIIDATDAGDAEVIKHLDSCAECRAERVAHDSLLEAFRGHARPAFSPHFLPQLMARAKKERRRKRIVRRRLIVLRLYWLAASAVCAVVLSNLTLFSSTEVIQTPLLFAVAMFAVPIAILLVAIRTDPFELILRTMTGTAENGLTDI